MGIEVKNYKGTIFRCYLLNVGSNIYEEHGISGKLYFILNFRQRLLKRLSLMNVCILQVCRLFLLAAFFIKNFCRCQYLDPNVAATLPQDAYTLGYQQQPVLIPTTYTSAYITPPNSFYPVQYSPADVASPVAAVPVRVAISPLQAAQPGDYSAIGIQIAGDLLTASLDAIPADASPKETKPLYQRKRPVRPVFRPGRAVTRLINIVKY